MQEMMYRDLSPGIRTAIADQLRPNIEREVRAEVRQQLLLDPTLREEAVRQIKLQVMNLA